MVDITKASVNQLIEALAEKSRWSAIVACTEDGDLMIVAQGANGMEILGGITMLQESQITSIRNKMFRSQYEQDDD